MCKVMRPEPDWPKRGILDGLGEAYSIFSSRVANEGWLHKEGGAEINEGLSSYCLEEEKTVDPEQQPARNGCTAPAGGEVG